MSREKNREMEIATTCVIPEEEEEDEKKKKAKTRSIIKVIAICGSLRKTSMNRGLIRSAIEICEEGIDGMEIEEVEIHLLPFINPDLEMESEVKFPLLEERRPSQPVLDDLDWFI